MATTDGWPGAPPRIVESGLIYAVARDITEQKRNQALLESRTEELARSNADLEQFAYVASHDLRAPLRSIVTLAEVHRGRPRVTRSPRRPATTCDSSGAGRS